MTKLFTKKNKFGFSLIELSIVILIIGILIIGISKGARIISSAKISSAKTLTNSSPVASIPDISLWLDASDLATIGTGTVASNSYTGNPSDGDKIVNWKDRSPQNSSPRIVSAPSDSTRPTYVRNGINGLPSFKFNGSSTYLSMAPASIASGRSNYTTVIVFQMTGINDIFLLTQGGSACSGDDSNVAITSTNILQHHGCGAGGGYDISSGLVTQLNTPYYAMFTMNKGTSSSKIIFYLNSNKATFNVGVSYPIGNDSFYIGSRFNYGNFFQGLISEIIIFDRALNNSELSSIQDYLSKKYGLK